MTNTFMRAAAAMAVVAGLAVTVSAESVGAQTPDSMTQLAALAREARTPNEHARVAKGYRLQAESFEAKAAEHEARVERLMKNQLPIAHKWPAMGAGDIEKAKRQALDARRAARQSREFADHHLRLSVEAHANANSRLVKNAHARSHTSRSANRSKNRPRTHEIAKRRRKSRRPAGGRRPHRHASCG